MDVGGSNPDCPCCLTLHKSESGGRLKCVHYIAAKSVHLTSDMVITSPDSL